MHIPGREDLSLVVFAAIHGDGARASAIQMVDEGTRTLRVAAQHGLTEEYRQHLENVGPNEPLTCSRAWASRHRIVIDDLERDPGYAPYLPAARRANIRSAQSTPILDRSGSALGILTTHYEIPHVPSGSAQRLFDRLARLISLMLECQRLSERAGANVDLLARDARDTIRALIGLLPRLAERGQGETTAISLCLELERLISALQALDRQN
jgi:GAF domain-containing protein